MDAKNSSRYIAGTKQVIRAVREGKVEKVIMACDVDEYIRRKIARECSSVPIEIGDNMKSLGKLCKISVGTAAIGILKD
ncbi:MAG TPA: ribosomal L7Ae/L30e/S12e/Gadd45 family protein [Clostridia bacterium]|nr:ribosomal L7Ae/L30e/S12e/Gadd45 family protein [Clostridia bacterium]